MTTLNRLQEVISSVVDAWDNIGVTFSVGSPLNNNLVKSVLGFEIALQCQREIFVSRI